MAGADLDDGEPGPRQAIGLGHGMDRDDALGLGLIHFAQLDQFRGDLAGGFDLREIVDRRHVLVGQIVDDIDIVLQAIPDQSAQGGLIQDPAGGVMGIVERKRAAFRPGGVLAAELRALSR